MMPWRLAIELNFSLWRALCAPWAVLLGIGGAGGGQKNGMGSKARQDISAQPKHARATNAEKTSIKGSELVSQVERWGHAFSRMLVRAGIVLQWYKLYRRKGFYRRGAWHLAQRHWRG